MSNKAQKRGLVPKLRFPAFREVGEWEATTLGKLGELISGLTYSPDDVRDSGLLVLRSSNVQNGEISLGDNVYVTPNIKGANLSKPNDILICVRNGSKALIGKNALIPEGMPLCTHGAFMTVFRSRSAKFVFQLFQSAAYQNQVDADLGATINSINGSHFIKYKFCVPHPEEQQKIADCLASLDERITLEAQKLDTLKTHKKGLMQQLFPAEGETLPKLRFPEFRDAVEWEEKKLIDTITPVIREVAKPDSSYLALGLRSHGKGTFHKPDQAPEKNSMDKLYLVHHDDLIVNITFAWEGAIAIAGKQDHGCYVSHRFPTYVFKEMVSTSGFFRYVIINKAFVYKLGLISPGGAGRNRVMNKKDLLQLTVLLPDTEEQQEIADCLASLDDLITAQTQKLAALKTHKKGLMQQLFPALEEEQV